MQPYVPAEAVQVELTQLFDGQRIQNVFHYDMSDPQPATEFTELGTAIIASWNSIIKPQMPTTLSLVEVKITDMTTQFAPTVYITAGLPIVGTNVSPALPNNNSLVITKRTIFRGRSFRGRTYFSGLVEGQVTGNAVSAAYQTGFINFCNAIRVVTTTNYEWYMAVVSKRQNNAWLTQAVVTRVSGFTTDGQVDSQRRRLPGRGA